jgi:hypothetical protein
MMAHSTDWCRWNEMAIASAEPKLTPALVTDIEVEEVDMGGAGGQGGTGVGNAAGGAAQSK